MSSNKTKVEGIYYNTSPDPVFFEGALIGGHDYVYIDGYVRLPGHLLKLDDPQDDPDAPETFRSAYAALNAKAEERRQEVSASSANRRVNVVTDEEEKKPARSARKGKRDSDSSDGDNQ